MADPASNAVTGAVVTIDWQHLPGPFVGAGTTLSAALAALMAQGMDVTDALPAAQLRHFVDLEDQQLAVVADRRNVIAVGGNDDAALDALVDVEHGAALARRRKKIVLRNHEAARVGACDQHLRAIDMREHRQHVLSLLHVDHQLDRLAEAARAPSPRRLTKGQLDALSILRLEANATLQEIKARYKELVKKFHGTAPLWSPDGRSAVYFTDKHWHVLDTATGATVEPVPPLILSGWTTKANSYHRRAASSFRLRFSSRKMPLTTRAI